MTETHAAESIGTGKRKRDGHLQSKDFFDVERVIVGVNATIDRNRFGLNRNRFGMLTGLRSLT